MTKEYFTKHVNIETKLKQEVVTKVIHLIKLGGLVGETFWGLYHKTYYGRNLWFP